MRAIEIEVSPEQHIPEQVIPAQVIPRKTQTLWKCCSCEFSDPKKKNVSYHEKKNHTYTTCAAFLGESAYYFESETAFNTYINYIEESDHDTYEDGYTGVWGGPGWYIDAHLNGYDLESGVETDHYITLRYIHSIGVTIRNHAQHLMDQANKLDAELYQLETDRIRKAQEASKAS